MKKQSLVNFHSITGLKSTMKRIPIAMSFLLLGQAITTQAQQCTSYQSNTIPVSGTMNAAFGINALNNTTSGQENIAIGFNVLHFNTSGSQNTGTGVGALSKNTTGLRNTANGVGALWANIDGSYNVAVGLSTLSANTSGWNNTGVGTSSLIYNISGYDNTACGNQALFKNTTGSGNAGCGVETLWNNTTGSNNTACGSHVLQSNTTGWHNTAIGIYALYSNTTGEDNSAIGRFALANNTTGNKNTGLGTFAGPNSSGLTNTTAIGYNALVTVSNKIRLGDANVTVVEGPVAYTVSDGRFKTNISETDVKGLEFIKKLRPVVYNFETKKLEEFLTKNLPESSRTERLNKDFSASTAIRQSGFIAQEVEAAAKETGYNFNGVHTPENESDNYSLAYGQFVVPLVKAVQELSQQNEEQKKANDALKKELEQLKVLIKNNTTGVVNPDKTEESQLYQNVPNSFNQSTTIRYAISSAAKKAVLTIVSIDGRKMKEFDLTNRNENSVEINTGDFAAGMYVYSLIVDDKVIDSKKMTLTQ